MRVLGHYISAPAPRRLALTLGLLLAIAACALPAGAAAQLRGAQMHPLWSDSGPAVIDQELSMLQSARADSVRIDLPWQSLEWTGRGAFDPRVVANMDAIVAAATAHGLKVILTLWESPCWASRAPAAVSQGCSYGWWNRGVGAYPPAAAADYADAAAFVARRWGPALAALEVWNEPNAQGFLNSLDQAGDYAALLNAAYPAVKAAAPGLPVLLTMAGSDPTFLTRLYAHGARGHYDGIAVHPYNDPGFAGLQAFRRVEVAQGDATPLWVTEFGWTSTAVGEQAQASLDAAALTALAALPYVAAAEVYNLRDAGSDPASSEDNFGLLHRDLSPKPAWGAFAQTLAALAQAGAPPATSAAPGPAAPAAPAGRPAVHRAHHRRTSRSAHRPRARHRAARHRAHRRHRAG